MSTKILKTSNEIQNSIGSKSKKRRLKKKLKNLLEKKIIGPVYDDSSVKLTATKKNKLKENIKKTSKVVDDDDDDEEDEIKEYEEEEINEEEKKEKEKFKNLGLDGKIEKYYHQRYRLFSNFDDGIILDTESWYSVTPEIIAKHIAKRCKGNVVVDGFCGAGGNSIRFAETSKQVYSVDIDPTKLEIAQHNYSVCFKNTNKKQQNISFIHTDYMEFCSNPSKYIKQSPSNSTKSNCLIDVIFLSPPWGGPNYINSEVYSLSSMTPNGFDIFKKSLAICKNIVYFLPKNTSSEDIEQLIVLSKEGGGSDRCELEENYINGQLKTITLYFGNLIKKN